MLRTLIWSAVSSCWREKRASESREPACSAAPAAGSFSTCDDDLADQRRFQLELGPLDRMLGRDMGDLMGEHRGDLGGVVGQRRAGRG